MFLEAMVDTLTKRVEELERAVFALRLQVNPLRAEEPEPARESDWIEGSPRLRGGLPEHPAAPAPERPGTEEVVKFLDPYISDEDRDRMYSRSEALANEAIRRVRAHEEVRKYLTDNTRKVEWSVATTHNLLALLDAPGES